jgi:hypothetical protein
MRCTESPVEADCRSYGLLPEQAKGESKFHSSFVKVDEDRLKSKKSNNLCAKPEELAVGCVLWLRHHREHNVSCSKDFCCGTKYLRDSGFNHPVVVLSIPQQYYENYSEEPAELLCSVACVSAFPIVRSPTKLPAGDNIFRHTSRTVLGETPSRSRIPAFNTS